MKTKFAWFGLLTPIIVTIISFLVACNKEDPNEITRYVGKVVYAHTTTPFSDCLVQITDGSNIHCQAQTEADGSFALQVRVGEINGNYYFLAGDVTCIPKKVFLYGYGQSEVDLGTIEVEGPTLPTVETKPVSNIFADGATCGGNVLSDGRLNVTARGICYGIGQHPTIDGPHTVDGSGTGEFVSTLKDLEHKTIYYVRAYATNSAGTAYGNEVSFETLQIEGLPMVKIFNVHDIAKVTAIGMGYVLDEGYSEVSEKGLCWSTSHRPTLDDYFASGGQGNESFEVEMNNLTPGTTYYVRSYATNGFGTGYSSIEISFTTNSFNIAGDWLCTIYNNDGSPYAENVLITLNEDGTANCFDYSTTSGHYSIGGDGTIVITLPYSVAGLMGTVELNGQIDDLNNPMAISGEYNLESNGIHIEGPLSFSMVRNTMKK